MINWDKIQTLLLDMDGTLLDLHFDNHFWHVHVPLRYGEKYGLSPEQAAAELMPRFRQAEGTLEWYCVDYWSEELGLDIAVLKQEVDHLIAVHPHVLDFLDAMRHSHIRVILVTNAHGKSLDIKMRRTQLGGHFDAMICSHDLKLAKETPGFWEKFQTLEPFVKDKTVLVDDSLTVLRAAARYGISHLIAVDKPDSREPKRQVTEFPSISSFDEIMP